MSIEKRLISLAMTLVLAMSMLTYSITPVFAGDVNEPAENANEQTETVTDQVPEPDGEGKLPEATLPTEEEIPETDISEKTGQENNPEKNMPEADTSKEMSGTLAPAEGTNGIKNNKEFSAAKQNNFSIKTSEAQIAVEASTGGTISGTVSQEGGSVGAIINVAEGETETVTIPDVSINTIFELTAAPKSEAYTFVGWYVDGEKTAETTTLNYNTSTGMVSSIKAVFRSTAEESILGLGVSKGGKITMSTGDITENVEAEGWRNQNITTGNQVTLTATPAENHRFVGWYEGTTDEGHVSGKTDKLYSKETSYTFDLNDDTNVYALFEEVVVLTIRWSSMDGKELKQPKTIIVKKGIKYVDLEQSIKNEVNSYFSANGYSPWMTVFDPTGGVVPTSKPISAYSGFEELQDDMGAETDLTKNTTLYASMYKAAGPISLAIERPVCGTDVEYDPHTRKQTNNPKLSVTAGKASIYSGDYFESLWVIPGESIDPFGGVIKGGEKYRAFAMLLPDFGYYVDYDQISVNNGTRVADVPPSLEKEGFILIDTVADHNWGGWEVTREPTETEEGEEVRSCRVKDCGAKETRVIPKLTVEYRFISGDGSKWISGSSEKLNFVVKRNRADETAFAHFKGIRIDGEDVSLDGYTAKAGSVVIDLKPVYLSTLSAGEHTLTAVFDDGNRETSAEFSVIKGEKKSDQKNNSKKKGSPDTGDQSSALIWLMVLCTAGLALSDRAIRRMKKN